MRGNHALQPHQAGRPEQVRADLALLEVAEEDAVDAPREQPRQTGLAHRQRQPADVLAVARQDVESIELHLVIVPQRICLASLSDLHRPRCQWPRLPLQFPECSFQLLMLHDES
jgi:hypothetical protein